MIEINLWNLVSGMVGDSATVHWGMAPKQTEYPIVVMNIVSEPPQHHLEGRMTFRYCIVQMDVYAKGHEEAALLKGKITKLDGMRLAGGIKGIHQQAMRFSVDTSLPVSLYRYSIDMKIHYDEAESV